MDGDAEGRVLIAFYDGPLVADPEWVRIDDVNNRVVDIEIVAGKQDEFDTSETNTATVRLNDRDGTFDPHNADGPYWNILDGKQILIQLWDPVAGSWHERFRGVIDEWAYDISEVTRAGHSILSNVTISCVGVFDYLARLELIAGVHGDTPPAGYEDIVFYEDGEVNDCLTAMLVDAGLDPSRYVVFSGNVLRQEGRWDSGESMLTALRDTADAETPIAIGNLFEDRHGRVVFHGRRSVFDPETVAADAGTDAWDFHYWVIVDAEARAQADILGYDVDDMVQVRPPFSFRRARHHIINAALIIPRGIDRATVPTLSVTNSGSISAFGTHSYTYQDSLNGGHKTNGDDAAADCKKTASALVGNYAFMQDRIDTLVVKAMRPDDPRSAPRNWQLLCKADISDLVGVVVGYVNADTGLEAGSTGISDDFIVQGWSQTITPLNADYDYSEIALNVSKKLVVDPYDD